MQLGSFLLKLTKPELEVYKSYCNFSHEDELIFDMLSKGASIIEISKELMLSETTVSRRIKRIKLKVERVMVIITQNGKEIKDVKNIKLPDNIKKEILKHLS